MEDLLLQVMDFHLVVLVEYFCAMKSHFRKFGNQMSGSGNHLCNYASLLAFIAIDYKCYNFFQFYRK